MALPSPVADFPDMTPLMDQARARATSLTQASWAQLNDLGPQAAPVTTGPSGMPGMGPAYSIAHPGQGPGHSFAGMDQWGRPTPGDGQTPGTARMPARSAAEARAYRPSGEMGALIVETAKAIGADPLDLATAISYETAGTFDPMKKGPTTQWGQHQGLIQFGGPQREQHGVDMSSPEAALRSQLGADGAVARYFRASGFKPGMSGLDLYSTINAGAPGKYRASDANNGGAAGDVYDKWTNQMGDHRIKAAALLGLS